MAILATLIGCQGIDEFSRDRSCIAQLRSDLVEIKEIVSSGHRLLRYRPGPPVPDCDQRNLQGSEYRVAVAWSGDDDDEDRLEKGVQTQVDISVTA